MCVGGTIVETLYPTTICAMAFAGFSCGIVDPISAPGFLERGLVLRRFEPPIHFRTLLLYPPDKQISRLVRKLTEELITAKDRFVASQAPG